jgi:O-antigen ligase
VQHAAQLSQPAAVRGRGWLNERTIASVVLLGWWLVQMAQLFNPTVPTDQQVGGVVVEQASTAVEQGSLTNSLLVVTYGLLGVWFAPRVMNLLGGRALRTLTVLLGLYVTWALFSILWSVDQALTIRRFVQLALLVVGSFGLGVGLYGRSEHGQRLLLVHVVVAGATAMAALWLVLLSTASVDLLNPAFAAKTVGLGTVVAHPVALSMFAAVGLWRQGVLRGWACAAFVGACLLALFAQKVRFIGGYSFVLLLILLLARQSIKRSTPWFILAGFIVTCSLAAAATLDVSSISERVVQYATLDNTSQDLGDLSGRAGLWAELQHYMDARPVLGYGFGAFWNPDTLHQVQEVVSWAPVVAHNGYIDEVLATGLIGAGLCLAFWLAGLALGISRARDPSDDFAAVVVAWTLLFLLFNWGDSIMQLYFRFPFYVALAALFALAARPNPAAATRPTRPPLSAGSRTVPRSPAVSEASIAPAVGR